MNSIKSQRVNNKISHLMNLRREALNNEGPNSKNYKKIDKNFKAILKKYNLIHHEYVVGFMNKK